MLPLDLVTLILLFPIAGAMSQNLSTTKLQTDIATTNTGDPFLVHTESTASGFEVLPTLSRSKLKVKPTEQPKGPDKVHTEISESGFSSYVKPTTSARGSNRIPHTEISETDFGDPPARTAKPPSTGPPPVNMPTVHTESRVPESALEPGFKVPGAPLPTPPNTQPLSRPPNANPNPAIPTANSQQPQQQSNVPGPRPSEPLSAPDILNNIAAKIFEQNNSNAPGPSQNNESPATKDLIPTAYGFDAPEVTKSPNSAAPVAQATPNLEATRSPQANPVITLGSEVITHGPSVLTLTPGLSTTIGSGTLTTFVAITTNTAGQTVVVIAATGTTTSSTITSRPKTSSSGLRSVQVSRTETAESTGTARASPVATTGEAAGLWHGGLSGCFTALLAIAVGMVILL